MKANAKMSREINKEYQSNILEVVAVVASLQLFFFS